MSAEIMEEVNGQSAESNHLSVGGGNDSPRGSSPTPPSDAVMAKSAVQPLLTDLYQISMCYGYWKARKHNEEAVFDLFFRKNPFQGEFTVFCGLEDCLRFVRNFSFSESDVDYIRQVLPTTTESAFFEYLRTVSCADVEMWAAKEGTVVFPREPLITLRGPLAICQLLETTLLNLVNFPSLLCTNAARFRLAAGIDKTLLEFGLRRAQGPNGALTASKYCYVGGFNGTSNVLAGKIFGIPVKGTMAHSFVTSFCGPESLKVRSLNSQDSCQKDVDFYKLAATFLYDVVENIKLECPVIKSEISAGELAAFVAFALAFPNGFLALIDTYDTLRSGILNFCACALALHKLGYKAIGIRIDSGDLAYLSNECRYVLRAVGKHYGLMWFSDLVIVASNDINEETIVSLNEQMHSIDCFGIGTHLVTCQRQPALGCVFKLVEVEGVPRIKLSQEVSKITMPGRKRVYRLYGKDGHPILDLMTLEGEPKPKSGVKILCRHPFQESKRAIVIPSKVEDFHQLCYSAGKVQCPTPTLPQVRDTVRESIMLLRKDHTRHLNPTPYKVSVSEKLYDFLHSLWLENAPIGQLE